MDEGEALSPPGAPTSCGEGWARAAPSLTVLKPHVLVVDQTKVEREVDDDEAVPVLRRVACA
jgi:hypothetical protein